MGTNNGRDFTLADYRSILNGLVAAGYSARRYEEADAAARHLILRHDVDMSLQSAVRMGEVEQELGLPSIYFVLLRTEMYNLFSARGERSLRRLLAAGHQVGLHFDASLYGESLEELETACGVECKLLEDFLGECITTISFHRPARRFIGLDRPIAGRRHAYEPCFVQGMGYCSDSRGGWYYGHPLDHPAVAAGQALQLLTHPIWWDAHPGQAPAEKLDRLSLERFDLFRSELAYHCEPYRQALKAAFEVLNLPAKAEGKAQ